VLQLNIVRVAGVSIFFSYYKGREVIILGTFLDT
jgi:hypothetical protein